MRIESTEESVLRSIEILFDRAEDRFIGKRLDLSFARLRRGRRLDRGSIIWFIGRMPLFGGLRQTMIDNNSAITPLTWP